MSSPFPHISRIPRPRERWGGGERTAWQGPHLDSHGAEEESRAEAQRVPTVLRAQGAACGPGRPLLGPPREVACSHPLFLWGAFRPFLLIIKMLYL